MPKVGGDKDDEDARKNGDCALCSLCVPLDKHPDVVGERTDWPLLVCVVKNRLIFCFSKYKKISKLQLH